MRRVATVLILISLAPSITQPTFAASKYKGAENATESAKCSTSNEYSFSKSGPLICSKGKWIKVISSKDTVATRAYRSLLARYNSMPSSTPNLIMRVDPTAGKWTRKIVTGLSAGARLWGTSAPTDNPVPAYLAENGAYISAALKEDGITENPDDALRNSKATPPQLTQAGFHGRYFDFIFSDEAANDPGFYAVGVHEYTHLAQEKFANYGRYANSREFWIDEGCATYVGTSMGGVIGFPQNQRETLKERYSSLFTPANLTYFSRKSAEIYSKSNYYEVYDIGSFACEGLVALKGIKVFEDYNRALAVEGATPESVAPPVFGASLDDIIAVLQKYVDSVRGKKELTLSQLQNEYEKVKISTK